MEFIALIISVVCLIMFFSIASNISVIKKALCDRSFYQNELSSRDYYNMYLEEKYIGNREKAREYLMRSCYKIESDTTISDKKKENFISQCKEELQAL